MSDKWTDRLSDYLDGELPAGVRDELMAHLGSCAECTSTLAELRGVVERARTLEDRPPTNELWSGIAGRIEAAPAASGAVVELEEHRQEKARRRLARRFSFSVPQLAAASIALMIASSGTAWLFLGPGGPSAAVAPTQDGVPVQMVSEAPGSRYGEEKYGAAIADLQRILRENRSQLDTATVRVIEENLMIIDRAIVQARRALAEDPNSSYLNEHLNRTMRQKLELLRHATALAGSAT